MDGLIVANWIAIPFNVFVIPAAVVTLLMVWRVNIRQERRWSLVVQQPVAVGVVSAVEGTV